MAKAGTKIASKDSTVKNDTDTAAQFPGTTASTETTAHVGDLVYDRAVLAAVAAGTDGANAFAMIPAGDSVKLNDLGLIMLNPAGPGEDGNIQAVLTPLGREAYNFDMSPEGKTEAVGGKAKRARTKSPIATPTNFSISNVAIPIPDHVRGTRGNELYPFRELGIGHSFHIPTPDAETQEVINSRVTSSISTANARYFDTLHPIGNVQGARFLNRKVGEDDPAGLGVRVWRVEDLTDEERETMIREAAEGKAKAEATAAAKKVAEATPAPAV